MKSIHGPEIEVIDDFNVAASRGGSVKSRLSGPRLCQEDGDGNALIADTLNDRLLLFTVDCKWHNVTPEGGLQCPTGALLLNGCLYVSHGIHRYITMLE